MNEEELQSKVNELRKINFIKNIKLIKKKVDNFKMFLEYYWDNLDLGLEEALELFNKKNV